MAIPDFQTLMLPVLREASTGEVRISEVVERLANEFNLSPEQRSHLLPSGRQTTFANRVHWAKSYLGKAGLIELTRRAYFRITDRGRDVLANPPEKIDIKYLSQFEGFQAFREGGEPADAGTDAMPDQPVGISPSARDTADLLSKRLVLIDGTQLARLMIQHGVGCRVEETLAIKRLDEDFFEG